MKKITILLLTALLFMALACDSNEEEMFEDASTHMRSSKTADGGQNESDLHSDDPW